jgi:DNA-binding response OmpR family regulator
LLVDDDPHIGAIFELLMRHYCLPFSVARDTEAALDYLRGQSPDIIVVDLFLPGSDGYRALGEISTVVDRSRCRILATTAYYTKDTRDEVLRRGFDGYIPKPFVPDSFLAYLRGTTE